MGGPVVSLVHLVGFLHCLHFYLVDVFLLLRNFAFLLLLLQETLWTGHSFRALFLDVRFFHGETFDSEKLGLLIEEQLQVN